MRRSVFWLSVVGVLLFFYVILWFFVTNAMVQFLNNKVLKNQAGNYSLSVGTVTKHGFPLKFGVNITSLVEDTPDATITHQNPVSLEYNLLHQGFNISYQGSSLVQDKSNHTQSGFLVESNVNNFIGAPLSFSMIRVIMDQNRLFELVNFVVATNNNSKVKVYNSVDSSLLIEAEYDGKVNIKNGEYYSTKGALQQSSAINHYHIESKINVNHSAENKIKMPISVIYGLILQTNIDLKISADASFPFLNPMSNLEFKANGDGSSAIASQDQFSLYINSKFIGSDGSVHVVLKDNSKLKEGFFDYINDQMALTVSALANAGVPKILADSLQNIANNPSKYYLPKVAVDTMTIDVDLLLKSENHMVDLDVRLFNLLIDNAGFKLTNQTHIDNRFAWTTAGLLSISNYDNMFDYFAGYMKQVSPDIIAADRLNIEKAVTSSLLRYVSNHPESESSEVFVNYSGDNGLEGLKIGAYNIVEISDLYKRFLYAEALKLVKIDSAFFSKIPTLIPELTSNKEVMKKLQEASGAKSAN